MCKCVSRHNKARYSGRCQRASGIKLRSHRDLSTPQPYTMVCNCANIDTPVGLHANKPTQFHHNPGLQDANECGAYVTLT